MPANDNREPIHGLVYPPDFLQSLPILLPRPAPHSPIRALTAAQFAQLQLATAEADVPDSVLFPFIHGLEGDNLAQNLFFASPSCRTGAPAPPPRYRGLIWVPCEGDSAYEPPANNNSNSNSNARHEDDDDDLDDLYFDEDREDDPNDPPVVSVHDRRPSSASSSSMSGSVSTLSTSVHSPSPSPSSSASLCPPLLSSPSPPPANACMLISSLRVSDILTTSPSGPAFVNPRVPDGISLRNFGIQAPIYATLSDIVVYSPKGLTRAAFALAERFKHAIEAKAFERASRSLSAEESAANLIPYNVFVVTDPFETFEKEFPHLVAVNSNGTPVHKVDFQEREKEEMRDLTRASEVANGVWLGNFNDVPIWQQGQPEDPFDPCTNPDGYDICIECHDCAPFPTPTHLRQADEHLTALDTIWSKRISVSSPVTASTVRPPPNANAVVHFAFPSSPHATQHTMNQLLPFVNFLLSVLSGENSSTGRKGKILLYSGDGYTESSVLALCILMAQKGISLPEAYIEMHVARNRSFFVYQSDVGVLRRVEAKLRAASAASTEKDRERAERESAGRWRWTGVGGWATGRSGSLSLGYTPSPSCMSPPLSSSNPSSSGEHMPSHPRRARAATSPLLPPLHDHQAWFNDPRFDGSFPSRVLPFLYLGNLNHASNAYMLHALGITHVVSVGECALVPPHPESSDNHAPHCSGSPHSNGQVVVSKQGSLWIEEREGRIKVLDIKGVSDDGIDSLRAQFGPIMDWIEKARLAGGKVLVHCRVGVSRSATVTIAYVMKHLQLSLVDAYLIVRSRRLSVLIQPNMRLLYNLCGWEIELLQERAGGDEEELKRLLGKRLNWPYLAREVHALNERYLQ